MDEIKMKAMAVGDTPLHTMTKIREATKDQKSPYLVLSGADPSPSTLVPES
jgi:hypothetical protein